jgi:hypothetical protein
VQRIGRYMRAKSIMLSCNEIKFKTKELKIKNLHTPGNHYLEILILGTLNV